MATAMAPRPSRLCFRPVQYARYGPVLVPCGILPHLSHRFRVSCSSGEKWKSGEVLVERGATGGVPVIDKLEKIEEEETEKKWWLKGLPKRYKLIGATSLAFVICNMDKVERETGHGLYQSVSRIDSLKPCVRPKLTVLSVCRCH